MTGPKVLEGQGAELLLQWVAGAEDAPIGQQILSLHVMAATAGEDVPCVILQARHVHGGVSLLLFDADVIRAIGTSLIGMADEIEQGALDQASAIIAKAGRTS